MAQDTNVNSKYAGSLAGEIFVQAFKKSDTISKNAITILPNNIGTGYLPKLSYTADLQDYSCGFEPSGELEYADKEVAMKKFKIDHEFCKDEFHQTFQAQVQGLFSADNEIPNDIMDAILLAIVKNLGEKVDSFIWNSATTGLLAKMDADVDIVDVTLSAVTPANVMDEIAKMYDAIPDEIIDDEDVVMVVAPGIARAYKQAQINQGLNTAVGDKELDYLGVKLLSIGALPKNTAAAYRVKNVGFLTGLESDLNEVRVIDHDATSGDGNVRTKVVLEMGVGYSFGKEIVLGKTAE